MKETAVYCCGKDFFLLLSADRRFTCLPTGRLRNDFAVKTTSTVERSVLNQCRVVDINLSMVVFHISIGAGKTVVVSLTKRLPQFPLAIPYRASQ